MKSSIEIKLKSICFVYGIFDITTKHQPLSRTNIYFVGSEMLVSQRAVNGDGWAKSPESTAREFEDWKGDRSARCSGKQGDAA
jgi:hypothetical protein